MPAVARAGDRALLVQLGRIDAGQLHAAAAAVRTGPGVIACIAGAESLYVVFDREPPSDFELPLLSAADLAGRVHTIEVRFDGADLAEFFTHVDRDEFFDRLPSLTLTARYLGFRAGYAYLEGWPDDWRMPRRPTSRNRVPRGTFAIAGPMAGFYPVDSPGGWNLLGQTDAPLWDARRTPPNLIAAGDRVKIVAVDRLIRLTDVAEEFAQPSIAADVRGFMTVVVGAPDWQRIDEGRPPGGAFDPDMAVAANRLVGNRDDAPVLECAMAGPSVRLHQPSRIAWCGADSDLPSNVAIDAVGEIAVGRIRNGLRGWLAIGAPGTAALPSDRRENSDRRVIRVVAGPHDTPLRGIRCEVTPSLNRVGIRMRPLVPIGFTPPADLPSCAAQFGTIQLHPDGSFVALGPDHPITGGYLQPFTVRWGERWKLAQLSPGEQVLFTCD